MGALLGAMQAAGLLEAEPAEAPVSEAALSIEEVRAAFESRDWIKARRLAEALIETDPGAETAAETLTVISETDDDPELANRFAGRIVREYPGSKWARRARLATADRAYLLGRYEVAAEAYEAFIEKHPDSPELPGSLQRLGLSLLQLERESEAREVLLRLAEEKGAGAHAARGRIAYAAALRRAGSHKGAIFYFEKILPTLRDDADRALLHLEIGEAYLTLGEYAKARAAFSAAAEALPETFEADLARNRIAHVQEEKAKAKEAAPAAEPAKKVGSGSASEEEAPAADGRLTVQIGLFRSEGEADVLATMLRGRGYEVEIERLSEGSYRIVTGSFADPIEAKIYAEEFSQKEGISAFVTER